MKTKAALAALFLASLLPSSANATPVPKLAAPIAIEQVSGGCGSAAFRTPWGACMTYSDYRRSGRYWGSSDGGWGRPPWQGGDSGYPSLTAGWRGGGYYLPE